MAAFKIEVKRFTIETIDAGDLRVDIDFREDEIGAVRAWVNGGDGWVQKLDMPSELLERIAKVVTEQRQYGDHHHDTRTTCIAHGYVKRTKSFGCSVCEPEAEPVAVPVAVLTGNAPEVAF